MFLPVARLLRSLRAPKGKQPSKCPRLRVEPLEERALFAVTASLAASTLTVNGDASADHCTIGIDASDSFVTVSDDITITNFNKAQVTTINVNLGGGDDDLVIVDNGTGPVPSGGLVYDGGTGTNTLEEGGGTWNITGANAGNFNTATTFSNVQNLQSGGGTETFNIKPGGSLSGTIYGGTGNDVLSYSTFGSAVSVNRDTRAATAIKGGAPGGFSSSFHTFVGSSASDTLTASGTWTITGANAGTTTSDVFSSFENLTGGASADTFTFNSGGSISGTINGSTGTDTVTYAGVSTPTTVNLASLVSIETLTGGTASDTLVGLDAPSTWNVTGNHAGNVGGVAFTSFETLQGGTGNDTYVFDTDNPLGDIIITDGGGLDTLDFSASAAVVSVNLAATTAQVVNSNLTLTMPSVTVENVIGGSGKDSLTGNSLNNTLNGQVGNDTYSFDTDNALGNDTITDSSGTDTLTFAATTTKNVAINLGITTPQVVNSNLTLSLSSASIIEYVVGGTLDDKLTGNSLNNILNGQVGNDTYFFDTDSALGNDTISESGVGTDSVNFSSTTTKGVTINLGIGTAQVVNSNLTLTLGSVSTIENVVGGTLNDSLTGNSLNNTFSGLPGNDTYFFGSDSALGNDTISESGGIDTLDFSATTTQGVTLDLGVGTVQVVNSNLTLTLGSASTIENIVGGFLNDNLTGNSLNNTLNGQAGNDTLIGGAGNDIYVFGTDSALGNDTITESDVGIDTLDFSATTAKAVTVNLGVATAQVVNSNLTLTLGSASTIENVVGGTLNDTLTGNSLNNTLNGQAGNDTYVFDTDSALGNDTISESTGTDTLTFSATTTKAVTVNLGVATAQVVNSNLTLTLGSTSAIEYVVGTSLDDNLTGNSRNNILNGQTGNDTYVFNTDTQLGNDTISESGVGTDTLDFSTTTTKAVAVNLGIATAQVVNSNLTLSLGSASTMENVVGGTLNDTLTGNSLNNTFSGLGGNDSYVFDTDSALGNDSISESGGTDTLDFSGTTTQAVAVNLGVATAQVVNSNLTLSLGSVSTIENVAGGSLDDTLTGNTLNNTLTGLAGNDTLTGQTGNDTYVFDTDSALGNDSISESGVNIIDSGGDMDTLDFSSTTTKAVAVNLGIATAQVVNSNLTLTLGSASTVENVIGGSLNDTLTGNNLNNVLSGGAGDDSLSGGDGRDILIGGAGSDTLSGGNEDDVLLGALYSQDTNVIALNALMSEWGRFDNSYFQRLDNMKSGGGNNAGFPLNSEVGNPITVTNDAAPDIETGNSGLDFFFRHSGEDLTDAGSFNFVIEPIASIP